MMSNPVYLLGAARTDFKRNLKKEGHTLRDIIIESAREVLKQTEVKPSHIQAGIVGNFASGQFTGQQHLGAYLCEVDPAMHGIATLHTEAACASGSVGALTAAHWIAGGVYDCVMVVGAEQQKTMSSLDGSNVLGSAGEYAQEKAIYGDFMFPKLFGKIAEVYAQHYPETTETDLARVAVKNYAHARLNPLAQTRDNPSFELKAAALESESNRRIAGLLKLLDCSQISDGAAAIILCSERFLQQHHLSLSSTATTKPVRLMGWGHTTNYLSLEKKIESGDLPTLPIAQKAVKSALTMAGLESPLELHGIDVHDCFSISELMAYEVIGLAKPGQAAELLRTGATVLPQLRKEVLGSELAIQPPFSIPVNPGGGLIGDGHPIGATGIRQICEAYAHLKGQAGARQIENATRYLTYNMGGSMTTIVAMVWGV